jgi:DNA-binding transcriptional regulator PaaX
MNTEVRLFSANLGNFSSRMNASLEKAITEAVVNSIQAHATEVDVYIEIFTNGNINSIEVIDNGDGFIKKNIDSFLDLHSDLKKEIGGKGVGRATWFKYFKTVSIDSIFNENDTLSINAKFTVEKDSRNITITRDQVFNRDKTTSVKLFNFTGQQTLNTLTSTLKSHLIKEMALMLYRLKIDFNIRLHFLDKGHVDIQTISSQDLPVIEKKYEFQIFFENIYHDFVLHCLHLKSSSLNNVVTLFVAGERTLSNFSTSLGLKITAPTNQHSGQHWLLLESKLLNDGRFTSEDRNHVVFPDGHAFFGQDIKKRISEALASAIASYFDFVAPDYVEQRKMIIEEVYDLYPQYEHQKYQKTINEISISTVGRINKYDLLKRLHEEDFSQEYHFKNDYNELMKSKKINEKTVEEITRSAEKTSEQAKGVLANYLWYRKAIIDQLQIYITSAEKSEELLHELFYKRHNTTRDIDLQNCIWLLDDKFMNFSYFASEGIVHNVIDDIYGDHEQDYNSKKIMDMFVAFNRGDDELTKDCVIIEFKSLGATVDDKANAASQVRRKYAQALRKHAKNIGRIFVFIITEIDEITKDNLRNDDFVEAVTRHGYMLNYYNKANDAHICFLSASTIIGDARDRHELFFKLLREELSANQRHGLG